MSRRLADLVERAGAGAAAPLSRSLGRLALLLEQPAPVKRKKEKRGTSRAWLFVVLFLIVLLAFLVVPIELQEKSKEMREVRDFYVTRPLFDEVEKIYDMAKEQLGLPVPVRRKQMQQQEQPAGNAPAANDAPANDPADSAPEGGTPPG
jgi:hypothetical protein